MHTADYMPLRASLTRAVRPGLYQTHYHPNTGYILEKILDPVVGRYRTPYVSGCMHRLPVNFLRSFLDMFLRPGLHHTLIFINMGGAIRLSIKDT